MGQSPAEGAGRVVNANGANGKQVNWGAVHRVRLGHVNRLLLDRYGFELPNDDAGAEDLRILLHVKANAYRPERREKALLN
jgi:hypothetical protein